MVIRSWDLGVQNYQSASNKHESHLMGLVVIETIQPQRKLRHKWSVEGSNPWIVSLEISVWRNSSCLKSIPCKRYDHGLLEICDAKADLFVVQCVNAFVLIRGVWRWSKLKKVLHEVKGTDFLYGLTSLKSFKLISENKYAIGIEQWDKFHKIS